MARSYCTGCQQTFNSVFAFDEHRIGRFTYNQRRCLTAQEMQAKGMTRNDKDWWATPTPDRIPPWQTVKDTSRQGIEITSAPDQPES